MRLDSSAFITALSCRITFVGALSALALVVGGCGGSKPPSVASIGTAQTTTAASASGSGDRVAFAKCMTLHGFVASLGSAANADGKVLSIAGVVFSGNVDPSSPQFQAALQACRKYLPGGGPPSLTPAQQADWATAMAKFAACMRKNGVPGFADPKLGAPPLRNSGIDPSSPIVQKAFDACQSLEPTFGPRIQL